MTSQVLVVGAGHHLGLLEPAIRPPFGEGGLWLVRPGGYTAAVARDVQPIAGYLGALGQSAGPRPSG